MASTRRLTAIMFTDIVGYTAAMQRDEADAIAQAKRHENVLRETAATFDGEVIEFYGDGSLSLFPTAVAAVQCAREIQKRLQGEATVPLRIGIHIGEILTEGNRIYGDGVNLASRIESSGHAGTILFSNSVYEKVRNNQSIQVVPVGLFDLKNVEEPMQLYALTDPEIPSVQTDLLKNRAERKRTMKSAIYLIPAIILLAIAGFFLFRKSDLKTTETRPSVAVLTFNNLSQNQEETEWFCAGVMEDVLMHLSKLKGLRVISRASVENFETKTKSVPEIVRELGVDYVLESSARVMGENARITSQLINAEDEHVWAENFDREFGMKEVFTIQNEVAQKIVEALKIIVSEHEAQALTKIPTHSFEAYELLLKGRKAADVRTREGLERSVDLYEQAISIDPEYAAAYAEMANSKYMIGTYDIERFDDLIPEVIRLVEKAQSIDPNIARCYSVLANIYKQQAMIRQQKDWSKAEESFEKALEIQPNDATTYLHYSRIYAMRPEPDYTRQLQLVQKALEIDPFSYVTNKAYIEALLLNGRYQAAEDHFSEMKFLIPTASHNQILREIYTAQRDWEMVIRLLNDELRKEPSPAARIELGHGYRNFYRDFDSYRAQLETAIRDINNQSLPVWTNYIEALLLTGDYSEAERVFLEMTQTTAISEDKAIEIEAGIAYHRGDWQRASDLFNRLQELPLHRVGYCYAKMGKREEALSLIGQMKSRSLGQMMQEGLTYPKIFIYAGLEMRDSLQHYITIEEGRGWRNAFWTNSRIFDIHYRPEFDAYRDELWYRNFLDRNNFPAHPQARSGSRQAQ